MELLTDNAVLRINRLYDRRSEESEALDSDVVEEKDE